MSAANSSSPGLTWLLFALLTVGCWGVYGVFLHTGQTAMQDPVNGRYKAFLFVGIAYFLTAALAPLAMLMFKGAAFSGYTPRGMGWSLLAGIVGAAGAFGVLLAFGSKGTPAVVKNSPGNRGRQGRALPPPDTCQREAPPARAGC